MHPWEKDPELWDMIVDAQQRLLRQRWADFQTTMNNVLHTECLQRERNVNAE